MIPKRILYLVLVITSLAACKNDTNNHGESRPNIIFIMSDDHAPSAVSCYGNALNETPNIDALAGEGIIFRNAFVTNSICAPSRAVILTGKHSHINGVTNNRVPLDTSKMTFPKILRANGYETAIVGKWHLKSQPTGFDYWNVLPGQGKYYNPDFIKNGKDTVYNGYITDITTDLALEWLRNRNKDKPFMLMIHHKAPHRNWMPDLQYLDRYEDVDFPKPDNFREDYSNKPHLKNQKLTIAHHMDITYDFKIPCDTCSTISANSWATEEYNDAMNRFTKEQKDSWYKGYKRETEEFHKKNASERELTDWKYQRYLQDYFRCIISVDESVGDIMKFLKENSLDENTLLIYTSDQGFFLGEHGLFDKRYMYEESMQTPLVMKYPKMIGSSASSRKLVQNLDIAPTLLEVAGVGVPESMQGRSLVPLFKKPDTDNWRNSLYYHFYEKGWGVSPHHGIRTEKYKLIHFTSKPDSWEMYNLEEDPKEMNNIYDDPDYIEVRRRLKAELEELQDRYMIGNENYDEN